MILKKHNRTFIVLLNIPVGRLYSRSHPVHIVQHPLVLVVIGV